MILFERQYWQKISSCSLHLQRRSNVDGKLFKVKASRIFFLKMSHGGDDDDDDDDDGDEDDDN